MFNLKKIASNNIIKNGFWMYLMQIFNTVIPLLTLPYITRILGASQYGVFSIALNFLTYFQVIVEYGFGMSATRKIALSNKEKATINKTFTTVLISRFGLFILCCAFTLIYFLLSNTDSEECVCLVILMVALLGNCMQLNWFFQGMQQMQFISIISIVSRSVSVALTFLFVKTSDDLMLYCLLYAIAPFINGALGVFIAHTKYGLRLISVKMSEIIAELKEGWYVFTTQLSAKVFGAIGITFLGMFATSSEVGIYSAINKIPNMIILAWTPIAQIMYPISSKKMKESFLDGRKFVKKMQLIIIPLAVLGALFIIAFSKPVIRIAFGNEYANFSYWIVPMLAWLVVAINNNFLGIQTLLGSGYDKEYSSCFQIGVICTILLNLILIYFFKGDGASIAPFLSESILGILLYIKIKKIEKEKRQ